MTKLFFERLYVAVFNFYLLYILAMQFFAIPKIENLIPDPGVDSGTLAIWLLAFISLSVYNFICLIRLCVNFYDSNSIIVMMPIIPICFCITLNCFLVFIVIAKILLFFFLGGVKFNF